MSEEFALISFECDGSQRELFTLDDVHQAIDAGELNASSELTFYANDGAIRHARAADIPFLAKLFDGGNFEDNGQSSLPANFDDPAFNHVNWDDVDDAQDISPDGDFLIYERPHSGDATAKLTRWAKREGDAFEAGDILCTLETARAIIRLPAPGNGTLIARRVDTGSQLAPGTDLADLQLEWRTEKAPEAIIQYFDQRGKAARQSMPTAPRGRSSRSSQRDRKPSKRSYVPPPETWALEKPKKKKFGCGAWFALLVIAICVYLFVTGQDGQTLDNARANAPAANWGEISDADFVPSGPEVTRWVTRTANVRSRPASSGTKSDELPRGTELEGRFLRPGGASSTWFQISSGPRARQYVHASLVTEHQPLPLLYEYTTPVAIKGASPVYSEPSAASRIVRQQDDSELTLQDGHVVKPIGPVAGGWMEIRIPVTDNGGVGYIDMQKLK